MAKKKNSRSKKNSQQKKNAAKVSNRNKQIKDSKKETKIPLVTEKTVVDEPCLVTEEEIEIADKIQDATEIEENSQPDIQNNAPSQSEYDIKEIFTKKFEQIKEWAINNKKVSFSVIAGVYTIVVILITIFAQNHITNQSISAKEQKLIEEMSNAESHNADISLIENVPYETGNNLTVEYCLYNFSDTVRAQDASELDNSYENTSTANTYLDVLVSYDNKGEENLPAKNFSIMNIKIGNSVYPCFSAIETEGGKSLDFVTDEEIAAKSKAYIHYIFDVPKEEKNSQNPIEAKVIIDNIGYIINLR